MILIFFNIFHLSFDETNSSLVFKLKKIYIYIYIFFNLKTKDELVSSKDK